MIEYTFSESAKMTRFLNKNHELGLKKDSLGKIEYAGKWAIFLSGYKAKQEISLYLQITKSMVNCIYL